MIGATLAAAAFSLSLAGPARAATPNFDCASTSVSAYCYAYVDGNAAGVAGLSKSGNHWNVLDRPLNGYSLKVRVYADNGNVVDYTQQGYSIYYGISHIYVWVVGYGLSPSVNVA
jgi:hypothetical protein